MANIYIWGTGMSTSCFLSDLRYYVDCKGDLNKIDGYIDNDEEKQERLFAGMRVYGSKNINWNEIPFVIIAVEAEFEVTKFLKRYGYIYEKNYITIADYSCRLLEKVCREYSLTEKISFYEKFLLKCSNSKKWVYVKVVIQYLYLLAQNIPKKKFIKMAQFATIIKILNKFSGEFTANNQDWLFFVEIQDTFLRTNLENKYKKIYEENINFLRRKIDFCKLDIVSLKKAKIFFLDTSWQLVFYNNKLSLGRDVFSLPGELYFRLRKQDNDSLVYLFQSYLLDTSKKKMNQLLLVEDMISKEEYQQAKMIIKDELKKYRLDYDWSKLMGDILLKEKYPIEATKYYARMMAKNANPSQNWMLSDNGCFNADEIVQEKLQQCFEVAEMMNIPCSDILRVLSQVLVTGRKKFPCMKLQRTKGKFVLKKVLPKSADVDDGIHTFIPGNFYESGKEYLEAEYVKKCNIKSDIGKVILPVMARKERQKIAIDTGKLQFTYGIGESTNRFPEGKWVKLCVNRDTKITSNSKFAVGVPVYNRINKDKLRVIINLFIDGLSFYYANRDLEKYMPYSKSFFSDGTIFSRAYSVSDWTQPSSSSMLTGMSVFKHQIINPRMSLALPLTFKTFVEKIRACGYYCTNFSSEAYRFTKEGIFRGFHRHYTVNNMPVNIGIEKMLDMMQHYTSPLFFNLHTLDVHDAQIWQSIGTDATAEINMEGIDINTMLLSDAFGRSRQFDNHCKKNAREAVYLYSIREVDRKLQILYDFLERNYTKDEYLVVLHSDHGGRGGEFLISREHTNVAMMIRGRGVPTKGIIDNEIISAMDLYSIYEKFCGFTTDYKVDARLPKAFGGDGREFAFSHVLYPGQTYKVAVNSLDYEFWLETSDLVKYDGRVSLDLLHRWLFRQKDYRQLFDVDLMDRFMQRVLNYISSEK